MPWLKNLFGKPEPKPEPERPWLPSGELPAILGKYQGTELGRQFEERASESLRMLSNQLDGRFRQEAALLNGFAAPTKRLRAGGRLMVYLDDATALASHARAHGNRCDLVVRPTNLEDVFLAITGTTLEGGS